MFKYSKLVSLALVASLGIFLSSCNDDEGTTPNAQTCNLKTATIGEGANADVFNFTYNAQNQLTNLSDGDISGSITYQIGRLTLNVPEADIADTMNLQGSRWASSFSGFEYDNNDSTIVRIRTVASPTLTGDQVTQLKMVNTETTLVNGIATEVRKDSSIYTFTYNDKGNVTRIAQQGNPSIEFTYADSVANVKVNNYFNGVFFGEIFSEGGLLLPFLTGGFKLINTPPSSVYSSDSPNDRTFLRGIKSDGSGNLSEISLYENNALYDSYKFTYECK